MNETVTIELLNQRFFAFHGYHEEEQRTGNEFLVQLRVELEPRAGTITGIRDTVNYVSLFEILREEMQRRRALLETLAMETIERIHQQFPGIRRAWIKIEKINPPIPQFTGSVAVTHTKSW